METTPDRIMLLGDTHANTRSALAAIDHAAESGAELIVQLGDFGFYPRDRAGRKFLRKVEARLALRGLDLWWIPGNHEDWAKVQLIPMEVNGRKQITEHVWNLPRGVRWKWDAVTWLAVGGAVSLDRDWRRPGATWFPEEELTDEQADRIIEDGPADVVLAHEAPLGVPFLRRWLHQDLSAWRRGETSPWPTGLLLRSDDHQRRIRRVVEGVRAGTVYHGHHHIAYADRLAAEHGLVHVVGLGMDTDPMAARTLLVDSLGNPIIE